MSLQIISKNIYPFKFNTNFINAFKNVESIKDYFNTIVKKISVEIINENEDSIIEVDLDGK